MSQLLLVRHGQSTWNAEGRWQGQADPPLSELGRQQAAAAARRLGSVDAIYSSSLRRAHETAEILAELLGIGPVLVNDGLQERFAGPWQGLTRAEIETEWPGYLADRIRPDGYEDDDAILIRVEPVLAEIATRHRGGRALVISHGGVVGAIETAHGEPWARLPNLSGRWMQHQPPEWQLGERVQLIATELDPAAHRDTV